MITQKEERDRARVDPHNASTDSPTALENQPAAHTPGPWMIAPRHPEGLFVVGSDEFGSVVCQIREYLAAECVESDANARLIAAAPDLLRELRHLVMLLEPCEATLNVPGLATLNGARAAIAKAEGR